MPERRILVVDDEAGVRSSLALVLQDEGFSVRTAADADQATALVEREEFDYILCDVRMPGRSGLELLPDLVAEQPHATIVMMSAYGAIEQALEAVRLGAYDYLSKPFQPQEFLLLIHKAEERERLRSENRRLRAVLRDEGRGQGLVTSSPCMKRVLELVDRAARFKTTVLITGESGVGKEVVARTIHEWSGRSTMPFVAVNCGAIPEALLETELFGHARGAFSGADFARRGLFREAEGGTLFLDEIGELPRAMQVKLLRVLQEEEVHPVGEAQPVPVDVRILAATARDLETEIRAERFRQDLYYRLDVLRIEIPPLRERPEDLPDLVEHFLRRLSRRLGKKLRSLDAKALETLTGYAWPGNVRELENLLERAAILSAGDRLVLEGLLPEATAFEFSEFPGGYESATPPEDDAELSIKRGVRRLEEDLIRRALEASGGNRSRAAGLLEISPRTLHYKLREYAIVYPTSLNEVPR